MDDIVRPENLEQTPNVQMRLEVEVVEITN